MSEREIYVQKIKSQLDVWSAEIDKLQAKAEIAEADMKHKYQEQVDNVKSLREAAEEKLTQLQEAGDSAWNDFKAGVETARDELQSAMEAARSEIQ